MTSCIRQRRIPVLLALACVLGMQAPCLMADEGFWLFSNPPRKQLKEKYAFEPSAEWLESLRKASVRVGRASGAFVSADGLILTNHHVVLRWLALIPGSGTKILQDGFYAGRNAEMRCPGLEVSVPWESEDVTARVLGAVKTDMSFSEAWQARRAVCQTIEKESADKTGLVSEVEALFHGAKYQLTCYRAYTDVRLVFAPDSAAGRFLDCCFLRAYEENRPVKVAHCLRLAEREPALGDLVFAAGYPASTDRLLESNHLDALHGRPLLQRLKWAGRTEEALNRFAKQSTESAWQAYAEMEAMQVASNRLWYALGPALESALAKKRDEERTFEAVLGKRSQQLRQGTKEEKQKASDEDSLRAYQKAKRRLAELLKNLDTLEPAYAYLESGLAFNCAQFHYARELIRFAEETAKPNSERLQEFGEASLRQARQHLLAPRALNKGLEQIKLAESLRMYLDWAGDQDELALRLLAGKTPEERARQLVNESTLDDAAVRSGLLDGGRKALDESSDPMIAFARLVDEPARKARREYEEKVHEPSRQVYAVLGAIRAEVKGGDSYPDATGSQRLSFGTIREPGSSAAQMSTFKDAFNMLLGLSKANRANDIPLRWLAAQSRLDESTPFWLSCSADIAPGNSGSPLVDRDSRLVAVAARSGSTSMGYHDDSSVGYGVTMSATLALLEHVYDAGDLIKELGGPIRAQVAKGAASPARPVVTAQAPAVVYPQAIDPKALQEAMKKAAEHAEQQNKVILPGLLKALEDSDQQVVEAVAEALGAVGSAAAPPLMKLLQAPNAKLRARAATALGKLGREGEEALPALAKALADEDAPVRRESARAIGLITRGIRGMAPFGY